MIIDQGSKKIIQLALKEDIGPTDITSTSVLHRSKKGNFVLIAKQDCIVCGLVIAEAVFETVDSNVRFKPLVNDGDRVLGTKAIAYCSGNARSILTAERTALNFLSWLSGISTLTGVFVEEVNSTKAKILDTRKTTPTLRRLEKYAVKIGGGFNHRVGLYDQVLIKDNHIASIMAEPSIIKNEEEAIKFALESAKQNAGKDKKIEIEVDNLDALKVALDYNPDIIMLDNMSIEDIKEAVKIRDAHRISVGDVGFKVLLEVSGGVNIQTVASIAQTGVDRISIGVLTHSAPAVNISLEAR